MRWSSWLGGSRKRPWPASSRTGKWPRPRDVDSERMLLRVERGKGGQYRNAMLPADLLTLLRQWWKLGREQGVMHHDGWLFPGLHAMKPISTRQLHRIVVEAAQAAFPSWSSTSVSNRARIFFKYQALIREHEEELAALLTSEHGKTIDDAKGDIFRGLEVVEHACSITSLQMGETVANVAKSTDVTSYRTPLGVCAGIAPFNFPAMVTAYLHVAYPHAYLHA